MKKIKLSVVLIIVSMICSAILFTSCKGPAEFEYSETNWNNTIEKTAKDTFSGVFLIGDGDKTKDLEIPYKANITREYKQEDGKNIGIMEFKLTLGDVVSGIDIILPNVIDAAKKKNGGDYTATYKSLKNGDLGDTYTIILDDLKLKDLSKLELGAKVWVNLDNNIKQDDSALKILNVESNIAEPVMGGLCGDIVLKKGKDTIVKLEDLIAKIINDNKGLSFKQDEIEKNKLGDFSTYLKIMSPYKLDNLGDKQKKELFKNKKLSNIDKAQSAQVAQYDKIKNLITRLISLVDGGQIVDKLKSVIKDITGSQSDDFSSIINSLSSGLDVSKIELKDKKKNTKLTLIEAGQSLNAGYSEKEFKEKIMSAIKQSGKELTQQQQSLLEQYIKRALVISLSVGYKGEFNY